MENSIPPGRAYLKRFSRIREIAQQYLRGPRAVMFPQDPTGEELWLEPVVRMGAQYIASEKAESVLVYCVPNCIEHNELSPALVRHTSWESGSDGQLCKKGDLKWPTIVTAFRMLTAHQKIQIDKLLRHLDQSLRTYTFPVEGLDLSGPSGLKPLPENAVIVTEGSHNELSRTTRFHYVEIHWSPVKAEWTELDQCWQSLFDELVSIIKSPDAAPGFQAIEKYDVEPGVLGNLVND